MKNIHLNEHLNEFKRGLRILTILVVLNKFSQEVSTHSRRRCRGSFSNFSEMRGMNSRFKYFYSKSGWEKTQSHMKRLVGRTAVPIFMGIKGVEWRK